MRRHRLPRWIQAYNVSCGMWCRCCDAKTVALVYIKTARSLWFINTTSPRCPDLRNATPCWRCPTRRQRPISSRSKHKIVCGTASRLPRAPDARAFYRWPPTDRDIRWIWPMVVDSLQSTTTTVLLAAMRAAVTRPPYWVVMHQQRRSHVNYACAMPTMRTSRPSNNAAANFAQT